MSNNDSEKNNDNAEVVLQKKMVELWKVSDFTIKVNELFKTKYNIEIKVTLNTLNNYFRQLENQGVHYLNRMNSTKVYDEMDLKVAEFILVKRTKSLNNGITWQIPQIIDALGNSDLVRKSAYSNFDVEKEDIELNAESLIEFKKDIEKLLNEIKNESKKNQLLLEDFEEKEKKTISEYTFELFNKQRLFRLEAVELWEQKSVQERFEGWLFKREKVADRDKYIEKYINDKLSEWINDKQL